MLQKLHPNLSALCISALHQPTTGFSTPLRSRVPASYVKMTASPPLHLEKGRSKPTYLKINQLIHFYGKENGLNGKEINLNGKENGLNGKEINFYGKENHLNGKEHDLNGKSSNSDMTENHSCIKENHPSGKKSHPQSIRNL